MAKKQSGKKTPKKNRSKRTDCLRVCTLDIETDPFKAGETPRPFLVVFFDGEKAFRFWGPDCILRFSAWFFQEGGEAPLRCLVYAHNGGKFDFHFLFSSLYQQNATDPFRTEPEIVWLRGGLAKFRFKERQAEFRDSCLILPGSLSSLEVGKKAIPIEWLSKGQREEKRAEVEDYCEGDCRALHAAVLAYRETFGQHFTIGGSALKMAQELCGFEVRKNKAEEFDAKFREFYFAGRCQAWETGEVRGLIKAFDIKSCYPWAMTLPLWHENEFLETRTEPKNRERLAASFVEVSGYSAGAFPVRLSDEPGEFDGRVIFPHCRGLFRVTGAEWIAAKEGGAFVGELVKAYVPQQLCTFARFVKICTAKRKASEAAGNKMEALFWKLLVNNLSGKLATNPRELKTYKTLQGAESDPEFLEDLLKDQKTWGLAGKIGEGEEAVDLVSKPIGKDQWNFLNVATAATITGHARAKLLTSILSSPVPPLYTDTDSLFFLVPTENQKGKKLTALERSAWEPFPTGTETGDWKEEARGDLFACARAKVYALRLADGKWKTASAGADLPFSEIVRAARGANVKTEKQAPTFSREGFENAVFIKRSFSLQKEDAKKTQKKVDLLHAMGFSLVRSLNKPPCKI